jgi:hypothetical protein
MLNKLIVHGLQQCVELHGCYGQFYLILGMQGWFIFENLLSSKISTKKEQLDRIQFSSG